MLYECGVYCSPASISLLLTNQYYVAVAKQMLMFFFLDGLLSVIGCDKGIWISPKIGLLFFGTLFHTLDLEKNLPQHVDGCNCCQLISTTTITRALNTSSLGRCESSPPNSNLIDSTIFAGLTVVMNTQTTPLLSVYSSIRHLTFPTVSLCVCLFICSLHTAAVQQVWTKFGM